MSKNHKSCSARLFFQIFVLILVGIMSLTNEREVKTRESKHHKTQNFFSEFCKTKDEELVLKAKNPEFRYQADPKHNGTLLHLAAKADKPLLAEFLLKQGFKINDRDNISNTPLHYALNFKSKNTVAVLMRHSASLNIKNRRGELPLHLAAKNGFYEVVKASLKAGHSPSIKSGGDYSPLHYAAMGDHSDVVVLLVENGADINARSNYGWTAGSLSFKNKSDTTLYLHSKNAYFSKDHLMREFKLSDGWPLPGLEEIKNSLSKKEPELFQAALQNDVSRLESLARQGKNFDSKSDAQTPLLSFAIINKKFSAAKKIMESVSYTHLTLPTKRIV